jgi:hypothetical protein
VVAAALAELRAKAHRSFTRQKSAIGLTESARRCVNAPAIVETLRHLDFLVRVYGDQAAAHTLLVACVDYSTPSSLEKVDGAWDDGIHTQSSRLLRIIQETTAVSRAS